MTLFDETLIGPLVKIVFLVLVGLLARASRLVSEAGTRALAEVVLNVTLPAMLFVSMMHGDLTAVVRHGPWVALAGLAFPLVGFATGAGVARLLRLSGRQASVVRVTGALSNTAFVGIPICTALWGPTGAVLAAIYDQVMTLPLLILPPLEYGGSANRRSVLKAFLFAPLLLGLLLGLGWRLTGLAMPEWLGGSLGMLGDATLPLSLVLVGALIVPAGLPAGLGKGLLAFLVTRLVTAPLAALLIVLALGGGGPAGGVAVLQAGMPASVLATVFAKEYGADSTLAASGALFSYVFALLTIPLLAAIVAQL